MFFGRKSDRKYKIALIDDEKELVDAVTKFLEARHFEVCSAYGGRTGLEIIRSESPDLIVLDIMMPDMDGRDILKELKKNPLTKNIPVILLSAKNEAFDEELGRELGADDYLTKPCKMKDLINTINSNLNRIQGERS
ncbi:response regulator transcription factor [Candidatus Omnitrophota bacterium]